MIKANVDGFLNCFPMKPAVISEPLSKYIAFQSFFSKEGGPVFAFLTGEHERGISKLGEPSYKEIMNSHVFLLTCESKIHY